MKVADVMTADVETVKPDQSIQQAASFMLRADAGSIPVCDGEKLLGMVTDRDIAVRAVAQHKGPDTPVRDVMSRDIKYCYEDEELEHVAENMADQRVRRLPVVNREKRLVGIVSLGDVAMVEGRSAAGEAVTGISRPGGPHSQSARA